MCSNYLVQFQWQPLPFFKWILTQKKCKWKIVSLVEKWSGIIRKQDWQGMSGRRCFVSTLWSQQLTHYYYYWCIYFLLLLDWNFKETAIRKWQGRKKESRLKLHTVILTSLNFFLIIWMCWLIFFSLQKIQISIVNYYDYLYNNIRV